MQLTYRNLHSSGFYEKSLDSVNPKYSSFEINNFVQDKVKKNNLRLGHHIERNRQKVKLSALLRELVKEIMWAKQKLQPPPGNLMVAPLLF